MVYEMISHRIEAPSENAVLASKMIPPRSRPIEEHTQTIKSAAKHGIKENEVTMKKEPKQIVSDGMLFVAHWTHTPENCPGRSNEGAQMLIEFWEQREEAERKGMKILGAYVGATEHVYFIIIQANNYQSILEFFAPLVSTQRGTIHPVTTMDEWTLFIQPKHSPGQG